MQTFQDNSIFANMIKNRPSLSIVPPVNKRILAQKWGITAVIMVGITSYLSIVATKFFLDFSSLYVVKTKKAFTFETDPFSGKVKCNYTEVPNKQYGF
jgi:hypothetical protein